jgi:predicted nucleic acid-binding protein
VGRFSAVIDANVLYSSYLRDLLLELGREGLFEPRWSKEILKEVQRALVKKFPGTEAQQSHKVTLLNRAAPSAMIDDHLHLVDGLVSTDPKDRHVLAAAIRAQSGALVTFNVKHFPADMFETYGIELLNPDDFLFDLADLNESHFVRVVSQVISNYARPALTVTDFASVMYKSQCPKIADFVGNHEAAIDLLRDEIKLERIVLERRNDGSIPIRVDLKGLY